jgi:hypothetical protein
MFGAMGLRVGVWRGERGMEEELGRERWVLVIVSSYGSVFSIAWHCS